MRTLITNGTIVTADGSTAADVFIDATYEGVGALNPAIPSAFKEWSLPIDQLGEGALCASGFQRPALIA